MVDVAASVAAADAAMAKLARFLSEFAEDRSDLFSFIDRRDSPSRSSSSLVDIDDAAVVLVTVVVLSLLASSAPMIS